MVPKAHSSGIPSTFGKCSLFKRVTSQVHFDIDAAAALLSPSAMFESG